MIRWRKRRSGQNVFFERWTDPRAQADAFAQLLALSPGDPDFAFREAARLAEGLFPHQLEGGTVLLGKAAGPEQASTIAGCGAGLPHAVTVARETLAAAKVHSTIDFVTGAVEPGEKVIVFADSYLPNCRKWWST